MQASDTGDRIMEDLTETRASLCLDCGKCTGICPVARTNHGYSPRLMLLRATQQRDPTLLKDPILWDCLTCRLCEERCPARIDYVGLMQKIRTVATQTGGKGLCSHGEALHSMMRIMSNAEIKPQRMDWLNDGLQISASSEVLFFVGCAPYFDAFFADLDVCVLNAVKDSIRLLNRMGIKPRILADERCCGHDLLWSGAKSSFQQLAAHNLELFRQAGIKKILTACPECAVTLEQSYADSFGPVGYDVQHMVEFLDQNMGADFTHVRQKPLKVTYQDPCRLGRYRGAYAASRNVLRTAAAEVVEMSHSQRRAICCGVANWMNCTNCSKQIQMDRLREARETGADVLATACPKCQIHFKCAMKDQNLGADCRIEIKDVVSIAAELMA
ncbi:MAG: (Fe-S)-binding protein [Acidobacteria bacterium]|nr:(Fe-S)-binding protein [Acidobacteriota bacterium]